MSQSNFKDDEVYLSQILGPIGSFFKSLLRSFFLMIQFIVKRIFLFMGILIVGLVLGYFLDQYYGKYTYKQEVIIEPRNNSTLYIYNFINDFYKRSADEQYLISLGLKPEWVENIRSIKVEPILAIEDVFDELHEKYRDNGFLHIIQDYSESELSNKKFIPFYKYHKITLEFENSNENNLFISEALLNHILTNEHLISNLNFQTKSAKFGLSSNRKSLEFIDNYLEAFNKTDKKEPNNIIVIAEESESVTVSGLLKQKSIILDRLESDNRKLELENTILSIVENTGVVKSNKKIYKRMIFITPVAFILLISIFYVFLFLYRKTIINEKQLS